MSENDFPASGNHFSTLNNGSRTVGVSGMIFQQRVKGTEKWFEAKTALNSPVVIRVDAPPVEGATVSIEVRCRPLKGNEQVGEWSPIYTLTVSA